MKKVLITGSKGFIGQNLKAEILKLGCEIIEINEDVFQYDSWTEDVSQYLNTFFPDTIFHVGACSDTLEKRVNYMMTLNFEFTKILTDWSKKNNCSLVYSSSAANYGTNGKHPSNLYGWSKYVAEQYVISNGGVALRYFNVYGPKEEHKGAMASVAYQSFQKKIKNKEIRLFPKKPSRDFVYVKDVVSANIFSAKNYESVKNDWYDVGSGESRTFEDVLDYLNIPFGYHSEDEIPNGYQFYTCSDKNKFLPNWHPQFDLKKGLEDYQNYLKNIID